MPRSETAVMLTTVVVTVVSHNLAYGVVAGVLVAMVAFARRVAHLTTVTAADGADPGTRVYRVTGELFFASSNDLVHQFDYAGDPDDVVVDLARAHIWDASTVATLDAITTRYAAKGKRVRFVNLDEDSARRHERLAGQLGAGH
jgi:sulfate permease, SulP family